MHWGIVMRHARPTIGRKTTRSSGPFPIELENILYEANNNAIAHRIRGTEIIHREILNSLWRRCFLGEWKLGLSDPTLIAAMHTLYITFEN
jgi:hypothetical protein